MTRADKAVIHYNLIMIITNDCDSDEECYERLLYAKSIIDREIERWNEEE